MQIHKLELVDLGRAAFHHADRPAEGVVDDSLAQTLLGIGAIGYGPGELRHVTDAVVGAEYRADMADDVMVRVKLRDSARLGFLEFVDFCAAAASPTASAAAEALVNLADSSGGSARSASWCAACQRANLPGSIFID